MDYKVQKVVMGAIYKAAYGTLSRRDGLSVSLSSNHPGYDPSPLPCGVFQVPPLWLGSWP